MSDMIYASFPFRLLSVSSTCHEPSQPTLMDTEALAEDVPGGSFFVVALFTDYPILKNLLC